MATSDMYKNSYTGKDNYIYLNDSTSPAKFPGASIYADGAVYTSDGVDWDSNTIKQYTSDELLNIDQGTLGIGDVISVGGELVTSGSNKNISTQISKLTSMLSECQLKQRASYEDTTCFTEQWADLTAWVGATTDSVQVSAGKVYANGKGGASGMCHALNAGTTGSFRFVTSIIHAPAPSTGGGIIIGVSSATAGSAPSSGGNNAFGIYLKADSGGRVQQMLNGTTTDLTNITPPSAGTYTVTVIGDSQYISITLRRVGGTGYEYRTRIARSSFSANNIYIFNSCSNLLTGSAIAPCGVRFGGTQTIYPRTNIEGVGQTVRWSGDGINNFRVSVPANYDSRIPTPAIIAFHGNGSDETHFGDHTNGNGVTAAFTDAGYIVISACRSGQTTTWGNSNAQAAYKAAYSFLLANFSISRIAVFANSMGGIESFNTISNGMIGLPVCWIGTAPTANLKVAYENPLFTSVIKSAYGIASDGSDYDTKTAGYDPLLRGPSQLYGVPMLFLPPTDDTTVPPSDNSYPMMALCGYVSTDVEQIAGITGGHSFGQTAYNSQMISFLDKWCK